MGLGTAGGSRGKWGVWGIILGCCLLLLFLEQRLHDWPEEGFLRLRHLGLAAGLLGTVCYALSFLLAQRSRRLDLCLGGLPVASRWHHRLAMSSLILLLLHPLLLAAPFWEDSWGVLLAHLFDLSSDERLSGWLALVSMLLFLLCTLLLRLPYHLWKASHFLAVPAFIVAMGHVFLVTEGFLPVRIALLFLAALALLASLRQIWGRRQAGKSGLRATVEQVLALDARTSEIFVQPERTMQHQPGQFAYLRIRYSPGRNLRREWHPFTIASATNADRLRFCIRNCGDDTGRWQQLQVGDELLLEGPFGQFFNVPDAEKGNPQVWIAGGIGITPFLGRIRSAPLVVATRLHYFVKSAGEALFLAELKQIEGLEVMVHAADQTGLPTVAVLGEIPSQALFFICGPSPMQQAMLEGLKQRGISKNRIFYEGFSLR